MMKSPLLLLLFAALLATILPRAAGATLEPVPRPGQGEIIADKSPCLAPGCHDSLGVKRYRHGPFRAGACLDCHNPHGSGEGKFLKQKGAALCYSCHRGLEEMSNGGKFIHAPVKQGECLACHDPHQSDLAFQLKGESLAELCYRCHEQSRRHDRFSHEVFQSGDCTACHAPHHSPFPGLLLEEGVRLCLRCHQEREEEFQRNYLHEPVKKSCIICHDRHGSGAPAHLLVPLAELCLSCHRTLNPELCAEIEHAPVAHPPVAEGKCTLCHTPHASNFEKQLNTASAELCFNCHEPLKKLIGESKYRHGPVRAGECGQCHLVHGAYERKLLRANFSPRFREDFALEHYALCFNCHNQEVYLNPGSKETGFRNGSGNLHFLHVNRRPGGVTCMACHDIHASNQARHIRTSIPGGEPGTVVSLAYRQSASGGHCGVSCHPPASYEREIPRAGKEE